MKKITRTIILLLTAAALLLAACAPVAPQPVQDSSAQAAASDANTPAAQTIDAPSAPSAEDAPPTDAAIEIANEAEPLPYDPDATHLSPEDWRDWPIVPELSERARVIYQRGPGHGHGPACLLQGW